MAKGDWEVYEDSDREPIETPVQERTACELYGHSFENVIDTVSLDMVRKCNDCGETYKDESEQK